MNTENDTDMLAPVKNWRKLNVTMCRCRTRRHVRHQTRLWCEASVLRILKLRHFQWFFKIGEDWNIDSPWRRLKVKDQCRLKHGWSYIPWRRLNMQNQMPQSWHHQIQRPNSSGVEWVLQTGKRFNMNVSSTF